MAEKKTRTSKPPKPAELTYRIPMDIAELYVHWNGNGYYLCPRCHAAMDREFVSYCDRCGQCLNWSQYKKATPVYAKVSQQKI